MKKTLLMLAMCVCALAASAQTMEEKVDNLQKEIVELKQNITQLQGQVQAVIDKYNLIEKQAGLKEPKVVADPWNDLVCSVTEVKGYAEEGKIIVTMKIQNKGAGREVELDFLETTINTITSEIYKNPTTRYVGTDSFIQTIANGGDVKAQYEFKNVKGQPEMLRSFAPTLRVKTDMFSHEKKTLSFNSINIVWVD